MVNVHRLTSLQEPGAELFATLTEAQLRNRLEPEKGVFIAESPKVIRVALDAGLEPVALLCEERHLEGDAADIIERIGDIPIYIGDRELLAALTGYTLTRGVLCAMRRPAAKTMEEVCEGARRVVVIDGVVDTTNIGAIFRSAAALGIDAVLVTTNSCDPLNRRAVRVSMGSVFLVPWTWAEEGGPDANASDTVANTGRKEEEGKGTVANTGRKEEEGAYIEVLRRMGFKTVAMALTDKSIRLDDARLKAEPKLALIMGTEGDGLPKETIASADYVVRIPMAHGVDSLNVAAASAVAFWELRRD